MNMLENTRPALTIDDGYFKIVKGHKRAFMHNPPPELAHYYKLMLVVGDEQFNIDINPFNDDEIVRGAP